MGTGEGSRKWRWRRRKEKGEEAAVNDHSSDDEEAEGGLGSDEDEEDDEDEKKDDEDSDDEENRDESNFDELNEINTDDEVDSDDEDIKIEIDSEPQREEEPKKKSNRQEAYSIFVRNIPYDADEESLNEHFEVFGPVKYALPVVDKETGLSKGSAFVAFKEEDAYLDCLDNAPSNTGSTSILIADDVSPKYVYQGRILSITSAVDRQSANKLAERNALKRKEVLGKAPAEKDKRNLFYLMKVELLKILD